MKYAVRLLPVVVIMAVALSIASAATEPGSLSFTNTALLRPEGGSEPAISIWAPPERSTRRR